MTDQTVQNSKFTMQYIPSVCIASNSKQRTIDINWLEIDLKCRIKKKNLNGHKHIKSIWMGSDYCWFNHYYWFLHLVTNTKICNHITTQNEARDKRDER